MAKSLDKVLQPDGTYKWELVEPTHDEMMGEDPITACLAPVVEPASSAFDAQSAEIKELQMQMATLGISTLSQQKFVAESADARRLDRVDTNSMLAMVCMELEQKLQKCFNFSAEYVGIEPPEVKISRDFDIERLIGQDITALTSLFDQQVIDREEFRDILVQGEVLPSANEANSQ